MYSFFLKNNSHEYPITIKCLFLLFLYNFINFFSQQSIENYKGMIFLLKIYFQIILRFYFKNHSSNKKDQFSYKKQSIRKKPRLKNVFFLNLNN